MSFLFLFGYTVGLADSKFKGSRMGVHCRSWAQYVINEDTGTLDLTCIPRKYLFGAPMSCLPIQPYIVFGLWRSGV